MLHKWIMQYLLDCASGDNMGFSSSGQLHLIPTRTTSCSYLGGAAAGVHVSCGSPVNMEALEYKWLLIFLHLGILRHDPFGCLHLYFGYLHMICVHVPFVSNLGKFHYEKPYMDLRIHMESGEQFMYGQCGTLFCQEKSRYGAQGLLAIWLQLLIWTVQPSAPMWTTSSDADHHCYIYIYMCIQLARRVDIWHI